MKDKNHMVLTKILKYCRHIEDSRERFGDTYDNFLSDFSYQNDCCMSILQIGELCKAISMEFRASHTDIRWREWCGIRDIMAHKYDEIDLEIAWDTIKEDTPKLKEQVQTILDVMEEEKKDEI